MGKISVDLPACRGGIRFDSIGFGGGFWGRFRKKAASGRGEATPVPINRRYFNLGARDDVADVTGRWCAPVSYFVLQSFCRFVSVFFLPFPIWSKRSGSNDISFCFKLKNKKNKNKRGVTYRLEHVLCIQRTIYHIMDMHSCVAVHRVRDGVHGAPHGVVHDRKFVQYRLSFSHLLDYNLAFLTYLYISFLHN